MSRSPVPQRIKWAVNALNVDEADDVLELGCGSGVAAVLVAGKLTTGQVTAVDRSAVAVGRAITRGSDLIDAGRLGVRQASVAELDQATERYDKIFAINVNLFWVRPGSSEVGVVRQLLRPGGELHVFYDVPDPGQAQRTARLVAEGLAGHGLRAERVNGPAPTLVAVRAVSDRARAPA